MLLMKGIDQHSGCKDPDGNEFHFTPISTSAALKVYFFNSNIFFSKKQVPKNT